jgi:hypothetical protein
VRRIVHYGNCQMRILSGLYRQFVAPLTGDVVSWINPYDARLSSADCATIAFADIIVGQVHNQKSFVGLDGVSTRAQRHLIPTVNASFLRPPICREDQCAAADLRNPAALAMLANGGLRCASGHPAGPSSNHLPTGLRGPIYCTNRR